jgi:hypothetical protein
METRGRPKADPPRHPVHTSLSEPNYRRLERYAQEHAISLANGNLGRILDEAVRVWLSNQPREV